MALEKRSPLPVLPDRPGSHRPALDPPRHCAQCGARLGERDATGGWPCASCGRPSFLDPKVAACVVTFYEEQVVLVRRAIEPRLGYWATPGGYCDRGESPRDAAAREAVEETGLVVAVRDLLGVYHAPPSPVVVISYAADVISGGPPRPLSECSEVGLFARDAIPWGDLAFPSVHESVCAAITRRRGLSARSP